MHAIDACVQWGSSPCRNVGRRLHAWLSGPGHKPRKGGGGRATPARSMGQWPDPCIHVPQRCTSDAATETTPLPLSTSFTGRRCVPGTLRSRCDASSPASSSGIRDAVNRFVKWSTMESSSPLSCCHGEVSPMASDVPVEWTGEERRGAAHTRCEEEARQARVISRLAVGAKSRQKFKRMTWCSHGVRMAVLAASSLSAPQSHTQRGQAAAHCGGTVPQATAPQLPAEPAIWVSGQAFGGCVCTATHIRVALPRCACSSRRTLPGSVPGR